VVAARVGKTRLLDNVVLGEGIGADPRVHAVSLPAWAQASPERRAHIERVVALLNSWADAMHVDAKERTAGCAPAGSMTRFETRRFPIPWCTAGRRGSGPTSSQSGDRRVEPPRVQHPDPFPVGARHDPRRRPVHQGIGKRRVSKRVMEPAGAQPAVPLLRVDVHRVRPAFSSATTRSIWRDARVTPGPMPASSRRDSRIRADAFAQDDVIEEARLADARRYHGNGVGGDRG